MERRNIGQYSKYSIKSLYKFKLQLNHLTKGISGIFDN